MRWLLLACVCACGSAPQTKAVPLPSATSAAPRPVPPRGPSSMVSAFFVLSAPSSILYADASGLARTHLASALLPQLSALVAPRDANLARCLDALVGGGEELLVASRGDAWLAIARYDESKFSPRACVERWVTKGTTSATPLPGVVVLGSSAVVEQALRAGGTAPRGLDLAPGEYVRVTYALEPELVRATLELTDERFALTVEADLSTEDAAIRIANVFEKPSTITPPGMSVDEGRVIQRFFRASKLTRKGTHLSFVYALDEGVTEQARELGEASALVAHAIDKYLLEAKKAEVVNTVHAITRSLVESWEREELPPVPRSKKKLRSFPPVPSAVPRGVAYQSAHADWASWTPLRFEIDQPQRYQYEVRAAPDGMSADVIARGDLNGDGKTSQFVIHVTVNKADRSLKLSDLAETDPDE